MADEHIKYARCKHENIEGICQQCALEFAPKPSPAAPVVSPVTERDRVLAEKILDCGNKYANALGIIREIRADAEREWRPERARLEYEARAAENGYRASREALKEARAELDETKAMAKGVIHSLVNKWL